MIRVAICAPSGRLENDFTPRVAALAAAEFSGVELKVHPQCSFVHGHFAGADDARLAALLECANDPDVDAVWFARGGYGSVRIAEAAIAGFGHAARGKTFLGYSDSGYLLAGLYRAGIGKPVHGPMPVDITRQGGEESVRRALRWFCGDRSGIDASLDNRPTVALNLMTLAMLCGTSLMPDLNGHVVLVEEVSEHLYAIDRLMYHITSQLSGIAGLRLGRVTEVPPNDPPFGASPEEIARFWCDRHSIAFLGTADIGHDAANKIVPFGVAGETKGQ